MIKNILEQPYVIGLGALFTAIGVIVALFRDTFWTYVKRPILEINASHEAPDCRMTDSLYVTKTEPIQKTKFFKTYYVRIRIKNRGKSHADKVECVLKGISKKADDGRYLPTQNWSPVNLIWSGSLSEEEKKYRGMNPRRELYCDIGHIPDPSSPDQTRRPEALYEWAKEEDRKTVKFFLDVMPLLNSQHHYLTPGCYRLIVSALGENCKEITEKIDLIWEGSWSTEETNMRNLLKIKSA